LILLDFGAEYAGYSADTTRTVPVNGKFTERQKEIDWKESQRISKDFRDR